MSNDTLLRRTTALPVAATAVLFTVIFTTAMLTAVAMAQAPAPQAPAPQVPAALVPPGAAAPAPKCTVVAEQVRLQQPLARVAFRLATGLPIRIVALGSSSTAGAGASSPAAAYPRRLQDELGRHFPGHDITVINRGVNGEEIPDMIDRFDTGVIPENPHLVLWQAGTNSLLRDRPVDRRAPLLHAGIARLKAARSDIMLIDPQYAPRVLAKPNVDATVAQLADVAREEKVGLFSRFAMMRRWRETENLPFEAFVSPDGLHLNDWSYACWAKWLGVAIADAATRPTAAVAQPKQ